MEKALRAALFPDTGENTYAIIDGASCDELLDRFDRYRPEHVCLYTGKLGPDIEECAPHLVTLLPGHPFTEWLFSSGFGKHWGIFALSPATFRSLRKHLRTFLLVKDPAGETLYFRYYDPRVLTIFLPTTNVRERATIFGPVASYLCETSDGEFVAFQRVGMKLERRKCFGTRATYGEIA